MALGVVGEGWGGEGAKSWEGARHRRAATHAMGSSHQLPTGHLGASLLVSPPLWNAVEVGKRG